MTCMNWYTGSDCNATAAHHVALEKKVIQRDLPHDVNIDATNPFVNPIQRSLIHKLHANANIGI